MGAIEAVGARISDAGGSGRFREALRLVLDPGDADRLAKAYVSRSKTAHVGRLHGTENRLASINMPGFFSPDPAWEFTIRDLYPIRRAAERLLTLALTDALDPTG